MERHMTEPDPRHPETYPNRVLVIVTGESPQVVTETVYALSQQEPAFVPTEVIVITTGLGARRIRETLLEVDGPFERLCHEYQLEGIKFSPGSIRVSGSNNGADEDAHSEEELARMGDLILSTLCELAHEDTAIHMSLAGGRKTMSFLAGQAINLVARMQDRLSHVVLSDKRFEFCPDFFFPPREPVLLTVFDRATREKVQVSTAGVSVKISDVRFLRLNALLGKRALIDPTKPRKLSELIDEANAALTEPGDAVVEFDTYEGKVWCNGREVPFAQVELGFYYTLARLSEQDQGLTRRASDEECDEYLDLRSYVTEEGAELRKEGAFEATVQEAHDALFGLNYFHQATRLSDLEDAEERRLLLARRADVLNPQFTNVNKRLIESLGPVLSQRFLCVSAGRPAVYYFPENVTIAWRNNRPRRTI